MKENGKRISRLKLKKENYIVDIFCKFLVVNVKSRILQSIKKTIVEKVLGC